MMITASFKRNKYNILVVVWASAAASGASFPLFYYFHSSQYILWTSFLPIFLRSTGHILWRVSMFFWMQSSQNMW
jgi:hypothetical protein